jgi:DNA-binding GntR family transcriptional regulator
MSSASVPDGPPQEQPATPVRGTTVDYVLDQLRAGVLQGRYVPGQRLIEADLTRDLGVSRGPLREAFRRLSAEGLLETVPNRGALVRRLTPQEMRELFQIRTGLECLAVELAAETTADPAVRAQFQLDVAGVFVERVRWPGPDYIGENQCFHDGIARASSNQQLAQLMRQLQLPLLLNQTAGLLREEDLLASVSEHRAIATAILAGDGTTAQAQMRLHLQRAMAVAEAMPPAIFPSSN